jgi:hypothetical protein
LTSDNCSGRAGTQQKRFSPAGFFFVFAAWFLPALSFAQSFHYYDISMPRTDGTLQQIKAFLVVEQDGRGTARLLYKSTATAERHLIELSLADSLPEGQFKYLVSNSQRIFLEGSEDSTIPIPRFVCTPTVVDGETIYQPSGLEYPTRVNTWNPVTVHATQHMDYEQLAKSSELVRFFYQEDEDLYRYLYSNNTRGPSGITRTEKMHLVIVAATLDSSIGITAQKDLANLQTFYTSLCRDMGVKLVPVYISGMDVSRQNVDQAINNLNPASGDIVVFHFSGHGFRYSNDTSRFPRMSFRTNNEQRLDDINMSAEQVFHRIRQKGARVNILVSDCCNENINRPAPVGRELFRTATAGKRTMSAQFNRANAEALYLSRTPVSLLIGSAEKDQLAVGNPKLGGFFTSFYIANLEKSLYGFQTGVNWLKLFVDARESTRKQALTAACEGSRRCVQTAEIKDFSLAR